MISNSSPAPFSWEEKGSEEESFSPLLFPLSSEERGAGGELIMISNSSPNPFSWEEKGSEEVGIFDD